MKKLILLFSLLFITGCDKEEKEVVIISDDPVVVHTDDYFEITLYVSENVYQTNEEVEIYGTIEYIGDEKSIEIWSGQPYMGFTVGTDDVTYIENIVLTILKSTILEKGEVQIFPLAKVGGFSENDEDADFWRDFYNEEKMLFPEGEFTVKFITGFYFDEQEDYSVGLKYEFEVK